MRCTACAACTHSSEHFVHGELECAHAPGRSSVNVLSRPCRGCGELGIERREACGGQVRHVAGCICIKVAVHLHRSGNMHSSSVSKSMRLQGCASNVQLCWIRCGTRSAKRRPRNAKLSKVIFPQSPSVYFQCAMWATRSPICSLNSQKAQARGAHDLHACWALTASASRYPAESPRSSHSPRETLPMLPKGIGTPSSAATVGAKSTCMPIAKACVRNSLLIIVVQTRRNPS